MFDLQVQEVNGFHIMSNPLGKDFIYPPKYVSDEMNRILIQAQYDFHVYGEAVIDLKKFKEMLNGH